MALTAEQQAEIEALAQQVIAAQTNSAACEQAAAAAKDALDDARRKFNDLRGQLYAQMLASGITPAPFVFGEFSFTPIEPGSYLLMSSPTLTTILQGDTTP